MEITDIGCKGNLLLNRMVGSHVIVVPPLQYKSGLKQMMEKLAEKLKQQGSSAYLIEVGGSSYMGMFGYLTAFEEMMNQTLAPLTNKWSSKFPSALLLLHFLLKLYTEDTGDMRY